MQPRDRPAISVVIPALDEQVTLGACLTSLARQDYPGTVEVIVVDNGSTDRTAEIARAHGAIVVEESVRGVCHARHRGTSVASGDIVVSSDADTTFDTSWLSQIDATMAARPDVVATCGPCTFAGGPWWAAPYTRVLFGIVAWVHRHTGRVLYATATNIAFRRSAWSGYDTTLTQGGDELGLLRDLRRRGAVHFDPGRVTLTSSRRLHRGLAYSVVVTCLYFYLFAYLVNRVTGRRVVGSAPAIRPDADPPPRRRTVWLGALVAAVAVAWRFSPLYAV